MSRARSVRFRMNGLDSTYICSDSRFYITLRRMSQLSELDKLLQQPPSQEAWEAICETLEACEDPEALQFLLEQTEMALRAWPDHLRVAPEQWLTDSSESRRLICRIFPLLPDLDLMDAFSAELVAYDYGEPAIGPYLDYIASSRRVLRNMAYCMDRQELYVLESNLHAHGSSHESSDILFRINYQTGEVERLLRLPRSAKAHQSHCDLLYRCKNGLLICTLQQGESVEHGVTNVFILRDKEIIHTCTLPGLTERRPPVQQRSQHARFEISEDEDTLWGYLYPDRIMRLDLKTFEMQIEGGFTSQVADLIPVGRGAVTVTSNEYFVYYDEALHAFEPKDSPLGSIADPHVLTFSAINALVIEAGGSVPVGTIGSFAFWSLARTQSPSSLLQFKHILYQRERSEDQYFKFRRIRYQGRWRVVYLNPPAFSTLVVIEFPTGLQAELAVDGFGPYEEGEGYGFSQEGNAIVFHNGSEYRLWRFQLGKATEAVPIA